MKKISRPPLVHLPSAALPSREKSPSDKHPIESILFLADGRSVYSEDALTCVLATMMAVPFDPNMTLHDRPLLHVLAGWDFGMFSKPIIGRRLPEALTPEALDAADLGQHPDGSPAPIDGEWLAGCVLAAGADPWATHTPTTHQGKHPAQDTLDFALETGKTFLIKRLLSLPGAPSAKALAERACPFNPAQTWWSRLCAQNGGTAATLLEVLAAQGADPQALGGDSQHPLQVASPETVSLYAQQGWVPTEEKMIQRIAASWRARVAQRQLSTDDLEKMTVDLTGNEAAAGQSRHEALVARMISRPIGNDGYRKGPSRLTHGDLLARVHVQRGPMRGTWTGLAACAYSMLRRASNFIEPERMTWEGSDSFVDTDFQKGYGWKAPAWSKKAGALAPALTGEWRPGVAMAAPVALLAISNTNPQGWIKENATLWHVAGVQRPQEWARKLVPDMVAWTEQAVGSGRSTNHCEGMGNVWTRALDALGEPSQWGTKGWSLARRMVCAVHGGYRAPRAVEKLALRLAELPVPDNAQVDHALIALDAFICNKEDDAIQKKTRAIVDNHPMWSKPENRAAWHAMAANILESSQELLGGELRRTLSAWLLQAATPETDLPARTRRMRM